MVGLKYKQLFELVLSLVLKIILIFTLSLHSPYLALADIESNTEAAERFIEDLKGYEASLEDFQRFEDSLDGKPTDHFSLDRFSLLQQSVLQERVVVRNYDTYVREKRIRFVNWWDVYVNILGFDDDIQVKEKLSMAAASGFQPSSLGVSEFHCVGERPCRFRLSSEKHSKLNNFFISFKSLATFGPYIVFIRQNSYDSIRGIQIISYIDLEQYNHLIGNEEIPVFEIPMKVNEEIHELNVKSGYLQLGDSYLHPGQLQSLSSQIFSVAFNLTANMADPKTVHYTVPLIDNIKVYLDKVDISSHDDDWEDIPLKRISKTTEEGIDLLHTSLANALNAEQKFNEQRHEHRVAEESAYDSFKALNDTSEKEPDVAHFIKYYEMSGQLDQTVNKVNEALKRGQTLKGKFTKMLHSLVSPQPHASSRIKNAIALTVAFTKKAMGVKPAEFLKNLSMRKYAVPTLIAAASMAYVFPDTFGAFTLQGLEVGMEFLNGVSQSLLGVGEAFWRSFKDTTAIVWDLKDTVYNNLLSDGKWQQLTIGLGIFAAATIGVLGSYHVAQNTYNLIKDRTSSSWQGLVARQERIQAEYLNALSEAEAEARSSDNNFSVEDGALVQAIIDKQEADYERRKYLKRAFESVFRNTKKGIEASEDVLKRTQLKVELEQTKAKKFGFWKAFSHVYLSYASYAKTVLHYTGIWNFYSALRYSTMRWGYVDVKGVKIPYLRLTPILLASRILYPNMFKTIVEKKLVPTEVNGGLMSLKDWLFGGVEFSADHGATQKRMAAIKQAEEQIMQLEARVASLAFKKAIEATVHFIKDDKELGKLFKASDGIQSISDRDIRRLSYRSKTFIRFFYDRMFEETMHRVLKESLEQTSSEVITHSLIDEFKARAPEHHELHVKLEQVAADVLNKGEVAEVSVLELKRMIASVNAFNVEEIKIDVTEERLEQIISEMAKKPEIFGLAAREARRDYIKVSNLLRNVKHEIVGDFDPEQDGSMKRYAVVQEKRKKPLAMARAVRAEISRMLVTLPLDVFMLLALTAGITEGIMKPLQPEMFGPNSIGYLSQYSFYGSLLAGVLSGMMANSWVKLQMDARHDDAANFGNIPRSEKDIKRGFWAWFWKQTNQRDNTLWANWKYYSKVVWHNIPAYIQNAAILNLMFIAFFDLDALVVGLATAFLLPISGFNQKLEQGFEKAAYFDAHIFPEKYVSHPLAQEYINKMAQRRRNKFNLLFDIFRNFVETWQTNAFVTPTETHPENRAFSRAIFGTLLAEKIITASQVAQDATEEIPVVNKVTGAIRSTCEAILGHQGVIHTKFPLSR